MADSFDMLLETSLKRVGVLEHALNGSIELLETLGKRVGVLEHALNGSIELLETLVTDFESAVGEELTANRDCIKLLKAILEEKYA